MIKIISMVMLFFAAMGCVDKESVPSGIMQRDSVGRVLIDLMQADYFAKQYLIKDSAKVDVKLETKRLYQAVFQIHHTTKEEFQKSYQFYINRPDLSKIMFDSLNTYANNLRRDLYKPKTPVKINPRPPQKINLPPPLPVRTVIKPLQKGKSGQSAH